MHRSLLVLSFFLVTAASAQDKVSSFGQYEGYSQARFEEWVTISHLVAMRDGVRLAVDITRPAKDGIATDESLPLVWTHSRYHRNPTNLMKLFNPGAQADGVISQVDANPALQRLVRHGYVVAAVGVRGSGASFGRFEGLFSEAETKDAAEMIAWFAAQPWCDGNVGMYGGSYLGITQYMAASRKPPALKAIFPDVAAFDMYDLLYPGGVFRDDMMEHWDKLTDQLDVDIPAPAVDGEDGEELLKAAIAEHAANWQVLDGYSSAPFRDDAVEGLNWSQHGPAPFLEEINDSGVAMYHTNGWFDVFAMDTMLWYANYTGPQRVTMGNWSHSQGTRERSRLTTIEQHRWFDRYLKGIKNGVDEEAPIQYALHVDPGELEWRSASSWPPTGVTNVFHSFVASGLLARGEDGESGLDEYAIDPTATTGSASRWDNAVGATPRGMSYAGLAARDAKALTWTTLPSEQDLTIVGHPLVTLFVSSSADDVDLVVVLEEVDATGGVHYLAEGVLRASQRKLGRAPYDNLGLPWQRVFHEDAQPLPADGPAEIKMDLSPIAAVIQAGHRLRVSLTCADADNLVAPVAGKGETLFVHRGGAHPSGISLPVMDAN